MKISGTTYLETNRLFLRPLSVADAPQMFENWASDADSTHFLTWEPHNNLEDVWDNIKIRENKYLLDYFYDWGIVIKGTNTLIGTITVVHQDNRIKMFEIGYVIGKSWWGKGYLPEALDYIVNYLFHATDVRRIEAKCDIRNQQSKKVLEKCGFTFEGILRQRSYSNAGMSDSCMYSILRNESIKPLLEK